MDTLPPGGPRYLVLTGCVVDLGARVARWPDGERGLTGTETRLLAHLASTDGRAVPTEELLRDVWGYSGGVISRTVKTTVGRLREKVEVCPAEPHHIVTVSGAGYRFVGLGDGAPSRVLETTLPPGPRTADPSAGGAPRRAEGRWPEPAPPRSPLHGRDAQIAELCAGFGPGLVTLAGPAGYGKTAVARAVAAWARSEGLAVGWVAAGSVGDADAFVGAVSQALGLSAPDGGGARALRSLAAALGEAGPALIVLDDGGALGPVLEQWAGALQIAAPRLALWVTAHEPLRLPGERVVVVGPLSLSAAGALLRARLPTAPAPGWEDDASLGPILTALGGSPLAIELGVAWADVYSPASWLARFGGLLDLPGDDRLDRPVRHRSLDAAIESSLAWLDDEHRKAMAALAAFSAPFTMEAAAVVLGVDAGHAARVVRTLVQRAQLFREGGPKGPVFRVPAGVGAWLRRRGVEDDGLARFAQWCARWGSAEVLARLDAAASTEDVSELGAAAPDLRRALSWALDSRDPCWPKLVAGSAVLVEFGLEGPATLERVAAWLEAWAGVVSKDDLAFAHGRLLRVHVRRPIPSYLPPEFDPSSTTAALDASLLRAEWLATHDPEAALERSTAARQAAEERDDPLQLAGALLLDGVLRYSSGVPEDAESAWLDARKRYQVAGHRRGEAEALRHLGILHLDRGRPVRARSCFDAAQALLAGSADRRAAGTVIADLALVESLCGDVAGSRARLSSCVELARAIGDSALLGEALCRTAHLDLAAAEASRAKEGFERAYLVAVSAALPDLKSRSLVGLAMVDLDQGFVDRARARAEEAAELARGLRSLVLHALAETVLGGTFAATGDLHSARAAFTAAEGRLGAARHRLLLMDLYDRWIEAEAGAGDFSGAEALVVRARQAAELSVVDMPLGVDGR